MAILHINNENTYQSTQPYKIVYYKKKILVIYPLTANWIVLETSKQLEVFKLLISGNSIQDVLNDIRYEECDIKFVVTQIEARRLFSKEVHNVTDNVRNLHLYLTNKCNLSCPHCYMFSGKANDNELTTSEVLQLINDYKTIADGKRITLSGGEPSTRIDFEKILNHCYELGLEVKVLTNGALLTRYVIDRIHKYISEVQISIDGYSEDTNAVIRGVGHFQKALEAVDCFVSHGVRTSIAITPSLEALQSNPSDFVKFAQDMISKYDGKPLDVKFAEGITNGRNISPSQSYNDQYGAIIEGIQKKIYGDNYALIPFIEQMGQDVILNNCMFGSLAVSSVGDVYVCPDLGELLPIANIRTSKFIDIYHEALKAEEATQISKLKPCNECELIYICGGGCRTNDFPSLAKRKSFDNIDYRNLPLRKCSSKIKERFYKLMIDSNEYLYSTSV